MCMRMYPCITTVEEHNLSSKRVVYKHSPSTYRESLTVPRRVSSNYKPSVLDRRVLYQLALNVHVKPNWHKLPRLW